MMPKQWGKKRTILNELSNNQFVSGEVLATQIGISRAAVSKHIGLLKDKGLEIHSLKGKGYKLINKLHLIDHKKLTTELQQKSFYFDELDSTNSFLLKNMSKLESGDLCIAESQIAGRGRRGRNWISPYGSHLYFSLYWHLSLGIGQAMGMSLVVACSVITTLESFGVKELGVKWPNDIYLSGRKLAGVLIEMNGATDSDCNVVIGVGMNISMPDHYAAKLSTPWNDLHHQLSSVDKTAITIKLHQQLCSDLRDFERKGLAFFSERWKKADIYCDKEVTLLLANDVVSGIYQGIDEQGALILKTDKGTQHFSGGEVSLRPHYFFNNT